MSLNGSESHACPASPSFSEILARGIQVVHELDERMSSLDGLILTGRPADIAVAANGIDEAIADAKPIFMMIETSMRELEANTLTIAAEKLRLGLDDDAADLANSLRSALTKFSKKSNHTKRRISLLHQGLNNSLRALQNFGAEESGRLLAEA